MKKEVESVSKSVITICDLCAERVRPHQPTCIACGGDFCEGCINALPAGTYDGQCRWVCDNCVQVYVNGVSGVCGDVNGIRERLEKKLTHERSAAQKLIDDIFDDIIDRVKQVKSQ